jgi:hydrogenase nickel incorporation protein HypA/HybF
MHELSIALSIIEGAEEEARRQGGGRVSAVRLRVGPLSGVVREALEFSYELASEGTQLEGSVLHIEEVPIRLHCDDCGAEAEPLSTHRLYCSKCRSSACRVISGDELEFSALELEELEENVPAEIS